jgi:6-phosphogluconolactonase (cycloisomerase 2 family)
MAFHPDRLHAYVLSELASSVTVFDYDSVRAAFIWKQTISTLPPDFTGTNTTAEIRIHPSGRFLYNTNRGHNSVTMFEIEPETGELDVIGWESTRGQWPRGMNIDPSGTFLYAANQNTDNIAVFRVLAETAGTCSQLMSKWQRAAASTHSRVLESRRRAAHKWAADRTCTGKNSIFASRSQRKFVLSSRNWAVDREMYFGSEAGPHP